MIASPTKEIQPLKRNIPRIVGGSGNIYEVEYSSLYTVQWHYENDTGKTIYDLIDEKSNALRIMYGQMSDIDIIESTLHELSHQLSDKRIRLFQNIKLGTDVSFPFHIDSDYITTEQGALQTYLERLHKTFENTPRLEYLSYVDSNTNTKVYHIVLDASHMPSDIDMEHSEIYLYFPLQWERYLNRYIQANTFLRASGLQSEYVHKITAKRYQVYSYKFSFAEEVIKWGYEHKFSEIIFQPVLSLAGHVTTVKIYGKIGTGKLIPYTHASEISPSAYMEILKDFTFKHSSELTDASIYTLMAQPQTFTVMIEDKETRWTFIPTGKRLESTDNLPMLVIRVYSRSRDFFSMEDFGLTKQAMAILQNLLPSPERPLPPAGLYIISGRTDSGKSTLLGILAKHLADRGLIVNMLEDPIERYIPGVNQMSVEVPAALWHADYEKAAATKEKLVQAWLDAQLRSNPDVVIVGEIRDTLMLQKLLDLIKVGKLVIATIHAGNAVKTLLRLYTLGMSLHDIASDFLGVSFLTLLNRADAKLLRPLPMEQVVPHLKQYFPAKVVKMINCYDPMHISKSPTGQYYTWKEGLLDEDKQLLGYRFPAGTHLFLDAYSRKRFVDVLERYGLESLSSIKQVFASSEYFQSLGEVLKYKAASGFIPVEMAVGTVLTYDELYPVKNFCTK